MSGVHGPKAESVLESGAPDGWVAETGWWADFAPEGGTRLVIAVPVERLREVHLALVRTLGSRVGFLYRQKVDRKNPRPNGSPARDFLSMDVALDRVLAQIDARSTLLHHDARGEVWVRGSLGEHVILDEDGVLYAYPDDPSFRDVLSALDIPERRVETVAERDYVKHWFRAEADADEDALITALNLTDLSARGAVA